LDILKGLKQKFESYHKVTYTEAALKAAVELSSKYIFSKLLPDKAIDVIDEAGAAARLARKISEDQVITLTDKDIEIVIAKMAQVPVNSVTANDKQALKDLDKKLKAQIFGQDEAIEKLVSAIKYSRTGLGRDNKPIGSYLFAGPTGVGKTEVCKQLALLLGVPFVRFDMSEYMEKHTVARLVGAPPGYVGYEEGGQLTEAITKTPYCVLLLDEIEKAHTDIYSILLQVMDAGRLTDSNGRLADFRNVILVMTSNAGAADVAKGAIGIAEQNSAHTSMEAIKRTFTPEFLNRLDSIVHFRSLDEAMILRVVQKFVDELHGQLLKRRVDLHVSPDVLKWLMQKGYDKVYGARPLARTIDEHLKKALVDELLFGRLTEGGKVLVGLQNGALQFHIEEIKLI
jgi:ATP-dependent Clp protease ATP-binding subunit ClpA